MKTKMTTRSVNPHRPIRLLGLLPLLALLTGTAAPAAEKTLIDYFLPMPITDTLSKDVWGAPEVGPRDAKNGLEDITTKKWCYWDGKILKGPDGKFHLYASRWDQAGGHKIYCTFAVVDVPKDRENGNDAHSSKIIVVPFDGAAMDRDLQKAAK